MSARKATTATIRRWEAELRKFALGFPEAKEEFPWGHSAFKVRGKVFLFMSSGEKGAEALSLSVKLPESRAVALMLPFAEPTGYGLGRSGWVSAQFAGGKPPLPMLREWIAESYRAIAPKRLLAQAAGAPAAARAKAAKAKAAPRRRPSRR
ncbi:MAG TPA: MmcQ/YjbR family DNA-binding protein [Vicinamibacteria bacterium]